jgi:heat shock protein HslJ
VEEVSKVPVTTTDGEETTAGGEGTTGGEAATGTGSQVVTVYVGPEVVDCEGEGPQTCLLVKTDPDGEYGLFYSSIDGFNYEPGFEYELLVRVDPVENPPAGASSLAYTLVEEVSKTPVGAAGETDGSAVSGETTEVKAPLTLEDALWGLQSYQDMEGNTQTVLEGTEPTIQFDGVQVNGYTGCNNISAGYEVNGNNIAIGQAISTLAACVPPEAADQERAYLAGLEAAATYEISGDTLTLRDEAGNDLVVFKAVEPLSLEGTLWVMTNYNNGQGGVVSALPDVVVTAQFAEGQVSGSAGCNSYNAGYEVDESNLTIEQAIATRAFCGEPEGIMEQENAYLAALPQTASFTIQGDRLDLFDAEGARLATFQAAEDTGLEGKDWLLISYFDGTDAIVSVLAETEITARFEEGQVGGNAGCNSYSAGYELDGDQITIGPAAATQAFCAEPEGVMDQELAYLTALQSAISFEVGADGSLTFFNAEGNQVLNFQESEQPEPAGLTGTDWSLTSFVDGDTVSSVLNGSTVSIFFAEDGAVNGSAGCNDYFGSYEADGNNLTIGALGATRKLCNEPAGIMEQETRYLSLLDAARGFEIDGNSLTLFDDQGNALLIFSTSE